jgi:hypothetical protein
MKNIKPEMGYATCFNKITSVVIFDCRFKEPLNKPPPARLERCCTGGLPKDGAAGGGDVVIRGRKRSIFASFAAPSALIYPVLPDSGRTWPLRCPQPPARQHQVGQAKQGVELLGVLLQPAIARLAVMKQVLDHMEGMLALGADARLDLLEFVHDHAPRRLGQRFALARPHGDVPADLFVPVLFALVCALVAGVTKDIRLLAAQKMMRLGHIIDIGCCAHHRVHHARVRIDPDVRLHATSGPAARAGRHASGGAKAQALACAYAHKVPLVAFLRLVHLLVTLPRAVLGRAGRSDQSGIHDGSLAHQQPLLGKLRVDGLKDRGREVLLFEQTAELEQRRGIRCGLAPQVDAHEAADGLGLRTARPQSLRPTAQSPFARWTS